MFNTTFNNISVISWLSVLLWRKLEKTIDLHQVTDKLHHKMLFSQVHLATDVNQTHYLRCDRHWLHQ